MFNFEHFNNYLSIIPTSRTEYVKERRRLQVNIYVLFGTKALNCTIVYISKFIFIRFYGVISTFLKIML